MTSRSIERIWVRSFAVQACTAKDRTHILSIERLVIDDQDMLGGTAHAFSRGLALACHKNAGFSENVLGQVLILDQLSQLLLHVAT